ANLRKLLNGRLANVGILIDLFDIARELDAARVVTLARELLGRDRRDFAAEKTRRLRGDRTLETARRISVHLGPSDLVLPGQILRGVAHRDIRRHIHQGFPKEVLELDLSHLEAAAA